jgi:hypothetical protein
MLLVAQTVWRPVIRESGIKKNMVRSAFGLIKGSIPYFSWKGCWRVPQKPPMRIAGLQAEISTQHLPNTKKKP